MAAVVIAGVGYSHYRLICVHPFNRKSDDDAWRIEAEMECDGSEVHGHGATIEAAENSMARVAPCITIMNYPHR